MLTARALYQQGIRPGDVVLNSWAYGTAQRGVRASTRRCTDWLNCVVITTSTGNVTSTEKQVELAIEYGATAILTTGDYLLRIAEVGPRPRLRPGQGPEDPRAIPNIGDAEHLAETFGAEYYRSYGFHEVQWAAIECPAARRPAHLRGRLHRPGRRPRDRRAAARRRARLALRHRAVQDREPAVPLQHHGPVVPVPARASASCGSLAAQMGPFAGRGDNMVKLRGVNIWPEARGRHRLLGRRGRPPTTSCGRCGSTTATSSSSRSSPTATRPSSPPSGAEIERRPPATLRREDPRRRSSARASSTTSPSSTPHRSPSASATNGNRSRDRVCPAPSTTSATPSRPNASRSGMTPSPGRAFPSRCGGIRPTASARSTPWSSAWTSSVSPLWW